MKIKQRAVALHLCTPRLLLDLSASEQLRHTRVKKTLVTLGVLVRQCVGK